MNTTQRKYLIDKITQRTKSKIEELRSSIPETISLNAHMFHKVISNDFEIQPIEEFFIVPDEYRKWIEERQKIEVEIQNKINALYLQLETLEIRIMIASDKTLQKLISEVDDMGDISLVDTKIKLLSD